MKILLLNTTQGLKPCYDQDYEEKKKLKTGETYLAEIRKPRNLQFHRKYFSLIRCAWEYQNEKIISHFNNSIEAFRKTIEIASGWFEPIYSIQRKEWIETPKSISFDKMSEDEFQCLYENVKATLFNIFLKNISKEEFEKNLYNF